MGYERRRGCMNENKAQSSLLHLYTFWYYINLFFFLRTQKEYQLPPSVHVLLFYLNNRVIDSLLSYFNILNSAFLRLTTLSWNILCITRTILAWIKCKLCHETFLTETMSNLSPNAHGLNRIQLAKRNCCNLLLPLEYILTKINCSNVPNLLLQLTVHHRFKSNVCIYLV